MELETSYSDRRVLRLWMILGILLVIYGALMLIHPVDAYVYTFQNASDLDDWWLSPYSGRITWNYPEILVMDARTCSYSPWGIRHNIPYPTSYWAATVWSYAGFACFDMRLFDQNYNLITSFEGYGGGVFPFRFELKKDGTKYYRRVNHGNWNYVITKTTVPYYMGFRTIADDIVIGASEEKNVISCPPKTWFVAKDMFDPSYNGLYSAPNTQVRKHTMYCSYATDDGSGTVVVEHVGSGRVVYTGNLGSCGILELNLTTMLFDSGAPYGQYRVRITGSSASDTFWYKAVAISGTSIQWDDTNYEDGDTATMTFSIAESYWDTDRYNYRVEVWDSNFDEVTGWAVTTRPVGGTKSVDVSTTLFPTTGHYYCVLTATDKSSGYEYLLCYDDAYMVLPGSGEVVVEGTTYDATTNTTLTSCTVTGTQLGVPHTTASNASTGYYKLTGLVTDWSVGMNASKSGYIGYMVSFTPLVSGTYGVDIPLVPAGSPAPGESSNATTAYYDKETDGTAIGGLCWQGPYWTASSGCTVTISNSTWNTSCVTGAGGWYQFNNIPCGGSYTLISSKSGYADYTKTCTLAEESFNREDCMLESANPLTVNVKDTDSLALLVGKEVTVSLDTGQTMTTTTGNCTFTNLPYGSYVVTASALGYFPGSTGVVMDAPKTVDVFLTSAEGRSGGSGIGYSPKSVKFSVQTLWGKPITNCAVNCTGFETSVGSWAWLYDLFGLEYNKTPVATSTMSGVTDDRGSINVMMLEPVQYRCTFLKPGEINKTLEIYPKDDYYLVIATDFGNTSWFEGGVDINAAINCTVTTQKVNKTAAYINFTYTDITGQTTGGTVYLNQTNSTPGGPPITVASAPLSAGCQSGCDISFLVTGGYAGNSYLVNCCPTHNYWQFTRSFSVTFPPEKVNPLGLSDTELMLVAVFFVLFTGCLFGGISAPHAPLAMSFMGWLMFALGWMDAIGTTAIAALVLATVISVVFLVMVRSKKERWI